MLPCAAVRGALSQKMTKSKNAKQTACVAFGSVVRGTLGQKWLSPKCQAEFRTMKGKETSKEAHHVLISSAVLIPPHFRNLVMLSRPSLSAAKTVRKI